MPRPNIRRAASKEALKQMQLLSATVYDDDDTTETFEITSEDDEEDLDNVDMPPKKKYKLTHRKSSDGHGVTTRRYAKISDDPKPVEDKTTKDRDVMVLQAVPTAENTQSNSNIESLQLDVWPEELTDVQLSIKTKSDQELKDLNSQLEQIAKQHNAEVLFQGEFCNALQLENLVQQVSNNLSNVPSAAAQLEAKKIIMAKNPPPKNLVLQPSKGGGTNQNALQLVMDPRLGVIVGTMTPATPTATTTASNVSSSKSANSSITSSMPSTRGRRRGRNSVQLSSFVTTQVQQNFAKLQKTNQSATQQSRPSEGTAVGGLNTTSIVAKTSSTTTQQITNVVDLTSDDGVRPMADTREIAFNKIQGKTFPSLVVVARPHLNVNENAGNDRAVLDNKVKNVLMCIPSKFTEWLIQQGLIKSEQACIHHSNSKMKLGMYSDVAKFPYSGGYVWISECCPHRFVSVFSGSLFEAAPHPPTVILKLIYHWACQTNIQNVVQWVKVDNSYVKGIYAWIRAICTVALHTHISRLGGPGIKVEVGVISLGTTFHDGKERKVKVEVLGLLEPAAKRIRLRAVKPLADGDCDYKRRFAKILEPLTEWVHPDSLIITDLTVDKSTLHNMGFTRVLQSPATDHNPSNNQIMEYLRKIVPRMFQNTLSLLSRQIIQQFLDELVWREWFGRSSAESYDKILAHVAEQTKYDGLNQSLIIRLNKVATNPFKNWSIKNSTLASNTVLLNKNATQVATVNSTSTTKRTSTRQRKINYRAVSPPESESPPPQIVQQQRPQRTMSPDLPEQMVPLENYYYGTIEGIPSDGIKISWNIKCTMCKMYFSNNLQLMSHLFSHAHGLTAGLHQCRYCLSSVASQEGLAKHIATSHPLETRLGEHYICIICETRFSNGLLLGRHMSKEHVPAELPYQCGTCSHRCSSHRHAIDHFYRVHDNSVQIQCPFCLKSMTVWSGGRVTPQNLNFFLQHLQKHQKKAMAKKCGKCALWFIHKDNLKEHQIHMHSSQRRKPGLISWNVPRNGLMVPKSKQDKQIWEDTEREFSISNLRIDAPNKMMCKECKTPVNSAQHYKVLEGCTNRNCQYLTCCMKAMEGHTKICTHLNNTLPSHPLKKRMHCICSFSVNDGNLLAKHLAECERKSAYPTADAAKSAIKAHSMLDVLGLVRRPEEPRNKQSKEVLKRPHSVLEDQVITLDDDDDERTVLQKPPGNNESNKKQENQKLTKKRKLDISSVTKDNEKVKDKIDDVYEDIEKVIDVVKNVENQVEVHSKNKEISAIDIRNIDTGKKDVNDEITAVGENVDETNSINEDNSPDVGGKTNVIDDEKQDKNAQVEKINTEVEEENIQKITEDEENNTNDDERSIADREENLENIFDVSKDQASAGDQKKDCEKKDTTENILSDDATTFKSSDEGKAEENQNSAIKEGGSDSTVISGEDSSKIVENKNSDSVLDANIKENIQNIEKLCDESVNELLKEAMESVGSSVENDSTNGIDSDTTVANKQSDAIMANTVDIDGSLPSENNSINDDSVSNLNFDSINELMETDK